MGPRILVADDDPLTLSLMRRGLEHAGYEPTLVADGESALSAARHNPPDLIVLGVTLPRVSGLDVCRQLRTERLEPPVLMLTARQRLPDRIAGLDAGADDCLAKPFAVEEALARIRALLRRTRATTDGEAAGGRLRFADLEVDPLTHGVWRGSRQVMLTTREFQLLECLVRRPHQVLSRQTIVEVVWGTDFLGDSNMIEVHIMRLRTKLERDGEPRLIHTIRGAGYSLREHQFAVC